MCRNFGLLCALILFFASGNFAFAQNWNIVGPTAQYHGEHQAKTPAPSAPLGIGGMEHCFDENAPKFSEWGYCHKELHDRGYIQDLLEQTKNSCCGGPESGECRLTFINVVDKMVFINHKWVSYADGYKPHIAIMYQLQPGFAIVCASAYNNSVYCIGLPGGE